MYKPNVVYNLNIENPVMEEELKSLVDKNLEWKMESALKKIYSRSDDVDIIVRIAVEQVAEWYNGSFKIEFDGQSYEYDREWFEILADLVNHAFDNFKQRILSK